MASQDDFYTCYRGRQSFLFHCSYLRLRKVFLALDALRLAGIATKGKRVFDYGFGSGTFFRFLSPACEIFGVEIDAVNVHAVQSMLSARGFRHVCLEMIDIPTWSSHQLLKEKYDVILCSHVLEHLSDPVGFLKVIKTCIADGGVFVGLVPLNERVRDPHHEQVCDEQVIRQWATAGGLDVLYYREEDCFTYWLQPLYTKTHGVPHLLQQAVSLGVGFIARLFGPEKWWRLSREFQKLTASRPTQAVFLLGLQGDRK